MRELRASSASKLYLALLPFAVACSDLNRMEDSTINALHTNVLDLSTTPLEAPTPHWLTFHSGHGPGVAPLVC